MYNALMGYDYRRHLQQEEFKRQMDAYIVEQEISLTEQRKFTHKTWRKEVERRERPIADLMEFECWTA